MDELTTMGSNVPDVQVAIAQWDAYQELCKGLLNETDYQKIEVNQKGKNGKWIKVEKQFKKKSAWQKLSRAFNVDTAIMNRELVRTNTGRIKEAYYCIRASLPNGRSVESDALCSRTENGKDKASDHTIMATAKTRATNRAISELIGAGEVSAEEMDNDKINHDDVFEAEVNQMIEPAYDTEFTTAKELKDRGTDVEDPDKVYRTAGDVFAYAIRLSDNTSSGILKTIAKLHAPNELKQEARELLIQSSVMIKRFDTVLTCKEICRIIEIGLNLKGVPKNQENYFKCVTRYFKEGLVSEEISRKIIDYLVECDKNGEGEYIL